MMGAVMEPHGGHDHAHTRTAGARALRWVLVLTGCFAVVEVVGGLATGSLALIADAGHMLSDALSVGLALFAIWLAARPPTPRRSFGYRRAEILAALANGITLVAIAAWILIEAIRRLDDPPDVLGGWMLVVALAGLAVNGAAATILLRSGRGTLNVEAAFRHVVADLLGSIGVIVAAVVILVTGWSIVDPLVSALIALLIAGSAWTVLRDATHVLLEGTPPGLDVETLTRTMLDVPGVVSIHDLHVWTITSGFDALSAHVLVGRDEDCHARRRDVEAVLESAFGITHSTLQVEHVAPALTQLQRRLAR
jgi:cobalt-zinc-cadmium efflux system protein